MQHNKQYCPAVIGMYYFVDGIQSATEISRIIGSKPTAVQNVLKRKYHTVSPRRKLDDATVDAIEQDYLEGMSTYEIGNKYGIAHQTVSRMMKKRGHVRGKGWVCETNGWREKVARASDKGRETRRQQAIVRVVSLAEEQDLELIEYRDRFHALFRCNICGTYFTHTPKLTILCPKCKEAMQIKHMEEAERDAYDAKLKREAEFEKDKICKSCGIVFHSENENALYCSATCARREKRRRAVADGRRRGDAHNHRRRARKHGVKYEPGITLEKLMERDGGVCQICGKPCDINDLAWGTSGPLYPSIDHVIPMAKGGSHTWDNVQLAHMLCNSYKRDL